MVRYLNPADHISRKNRKSDKDFAKRLDFKDIKFPVKVKDIHKIVKKNSIVISAFGYENEEKYPIYVFKKCCEETHADLLLIGEREQNFMFLSMTSIDSCIINHSLHRGK